MWVARCEWGSARLSAGVPRLPPANEEDVSLIPDVGISPRAEVRKEKSSGGRDRRGNSGREMESFQKSPRDQDHPAWPAGTNSGLCAVAGVALPLGFKVLAHIQVIYLGRVGKVQQQLAWGSAHVYAETPPHGPAALQWGRSLRGTAGCMGDDSPAMTNFRIVYHCSKCPDRVFICVTSGFLMSNVKGDIRGPESGWKYLSPACTGVKTWGGHVQPAPLGLGFRLTPQHSGVQPLL